MIQHRARIGGIAAHQGRLQEGAGVIALLEEAKQITSGILVGNGIHSLNNPGLQAKVKLKERETLDAQVADVQKKRKELLSKIRNVEANRQARGCGELNGFQNWDARQCCDYLQYKKTDTNTAMPKSVAALQLRCQEVMDRVSPMASPHPSDDENSTGEENEESLVEN